LSEGEMGKEKREIPVKLDTETCERRTFVCMPLR
jgi:hypothetical protein